MTKEEIFYLMRNYEDYSNPKIKQTFNWHENNSDIRWQANCVNEFENETITDYYLTDDYARKTRWDFWNNVVDLFLKHNIKTNLDIGCANNHFAFLCNKKDIFCVGIDPRENCVKHSHSVFEREFGKTYGYVGNIQTFNEYFRIYNQPIFDCISILNFLHGNDHVPSEIEDLFRVLPRISRYAIITEPKWNDLKIPKYTDNYEVIEKVDNTIIEHTLYKLQETNENS